MSNLSTTIQIASIIDQQLILLNFLSEIYHQMERELTPDQYSKIRAIHNKIRDDLGSEKVLLEATLEGE